VRSQAAISTASCSDPTGLLETNSLLRCDIVSDKRVPEEGSLAIIAISKERVYGVTAVVVAAVVVAAVVVAAVVVAAVVVAEVVAAAVAESRLVAAVVVVRDASKSMASLSATVMSLIDVNIKLVVGCWLWLRWQYWAQWSVP